MQQSEKENESSLFQTWISNINLMCAFICVKQPSWWEQICVKQPLRCSCQVSIYHWKKHVCTCVYHLHKEEVMLKMYAYGILIVADVLHYWCVTCMFMFE